MLIGFVCLICRVFPAEQTKAGWWNEHWEYRLPVTLQNPLDTDLKNVPVIITGENFMNKAGFTDEKISTLSLRLIDSAGKEVPVQVDEKDNTGLYLENGNGILDKGDEIVFEISLKPKEKQTLTFYFRKGGLVPRESYQTDLKFEKVNFGDQGAVYNALLSNSIIQIGIRGDASEKNSDGTLPLLGWAKASITSLKLNNVDLIQLGSYDWFLGNSPLVRDIAPLIPWKNPELVINGPVRIIVACKAANVDKNFTELMKDQSWRLSGRFKGDIIRYFILYSGSPLCEMDETYRIEKADAGFNCMYEFCWKPSYPRDWDNDLMYVPLGDKAVVINFKDNRNYTTDKTSEGWFVVANPKVSRGLAVFFNKDLATSIYGDFFPPGAKREDIMTSDWGKSNLSPYFRVFYIYTDFNLKPVQQNVFGYYVVTTETAQDVKAIYQLVWEDGLLKAADFGFPEEK